MELQNSAAVVHFCLEFGSSSRNHYYGPRYGVGVKLPIIVIHYTKKTICSILIPPRLHSLVHLLSAAATTLTSLPAGPALRAGTTRDP
jgi:hypothetical protein